ncbi:nucleolar complex-associated protein-domain-containing protein [Hygrophoropsis aurantiaca]|uniref:Nucleolar complex-associated protein-domain-containing protein n=1 Tax=Hygrophoropsis aurantiaca TaxID=72124 RepID=A0ACB8AUI1_9AGAM|nr:nucleolar complex-associated protein-domain-containing protein [Hygrophoropsis aurantiaca]
MPKARNEINNLDLQRDDMKSKLKKRPAPVAQQRPSKKQKLQSDKSTKPISQKSKNLVRSKGKEKASDRQFISIPGVAGDDTADSDLSDEDVGLLEEFGDAAGFLSTLDQKSITISKKETERLRQLSKPARKPKEIDNLPSIHSHDSDSDVWSSGISDEDGPSLSEGEGDSDDDDNPVIGSDSDVEMPYETVPRKRRPSWESKDDDDIHGLPIKLADGRIQSTGKKVSFPKKGQEKADESESETSSSEQVQEPTRRTDDVSTGARFGRPAVIDVVGNKSRAIRIQGAKDQIASICQEIMAEPENSLGLLRRLHTFSLAKISSPTHPEPVTNDPMVRKLAILSQLAVYKDIIPGYRIRALTDKEKAEKVSQMVARTREWEQGLVVVYQSYLTSLETELKGKTELSETALRCICTLTTEATHFNFRVNLMTCIVSHLSKKSWDASSDLCLNTLITVFREDLTGVPSSEVVQLLNRMIKERRFNVHPEVLTCLLHLRLKTELGVRASDSKADREDKGKVHSQGKAAARRAKGKPTQQPHLSKKAKKVYKENKEIAREVREAEAEVDKDERAATHTETLKLLFVLYFRILKATRPTPLLPAALRGISKFAHLVNIDFFKDLMQVLKELIVRESGESDGSESESSRDNGAVEIQHRLLCIVTAFELLSGQGEALNIDLGDFVNHLYAIIMPVSQLPGIEDTPQSTFHANFRVAKPPSIADMLFRALNVIFSPRSSGSAALAWRSAAFAKRLLVASLNWPSSTALRALEFVDGLIAKDPKLEALLSTEDRTVDGVYRPEIDDPQLCHPFGTSFWELQLLRQYHYDPLVRESAHKLFHYTRS